MIQDPHLLQEQERQRIQKLPPLPPRQPPTISCKDLPEPVPGSPIAMEWNYYRRVVERLLAEGHEGRWVLIKNEEIVGIWDTEVEANQARLEKFLLQPVLMKQILAREPVLRGGGYFRPWPS